MVINSTFSIVKSTNGIFSLVYGSDAAVITQNNKDYPMLDTLYKEFRNGNPISRIETFHNNDAFLRSIINDALQNIAQGSPVVNSKEVTINGLSNLLRFCKEFDFTPNYRFINTLAHYLAVNPKSATTYIAHYFALIDSPYAKEVVSKMRSAEFKAILKDLSTTAPNKAINSRFKIYYGDAGTGKTTRAQEQSDGRCIVCNASMLPADLMEDFVFVEGKPSFKPSALWECMEQGKSITLDEINLLPFDSLRFLQGILDGKKEFLYKGHTVTIADGFEIIGTMNLVVNGSVFNLPEPLVDRCAYIEKFELTAEDLYSAF